MNDMSHAIVPKSDQINADDLISGPINITIEAVEIKGGQEQPVSIFFAGSEKAFRPCKSMSRVLVAAWGPDANKYVGRSLTLYRDPTVKWGGMDVGGIRISHMTDIDNAMTMALTATKGSRKPFTVKPLTAPRAEAGATDKAAVGTRAFIKRLQNAGSPDAVAVILADPKVIENRAWTLANRPELAALIDEAVDALRPSPAAGGFDTETGEITDQPAAAHAPAATPEPLLQSDENAGSDEDALPARADADHGDGFTDADEPHPAERAANRLMERIKASTDIGLFNKLVNDAKDHIAAMPAEMAATVNGLIERKRAQLKSSL